MNFTDMETPALILDQDRLARNASRMLTHCAERGVMLRPHLKTPKSADVAVVATGGRMDTITVSTLWEAEYFAKAGFDDILYAVGITPNKFPRAARIGAETGRTVRLVVDSPEMATAISDSALTNPVLIELDCGEHRGGLSAEDRALVEIADILGEQLAGVMTHAGHSYATDQIDEVKHVAAVEVATARRAADRLRGFGHDVTTVSIGSTPTLLHAEDLSGVTEVRAGVYLFGDLAQYGRNICGTDEIALSVLSTVIGHNRAAGVLTVDAGALALSKDIGANTHLPSAKYGWLCDLETLEPLGLAVDAVHQEHGTVTISDASVYERLPIGSMVRILPNHACLTAAGGYGQYHCLDGAVWPRIDGWG